MSEYTPITGELRDAMCQWGWVEMDGSIMFTTSPTPPSIDAEQSLAISGSDFDRLCDSIDSIHAQLERENAELKAEHDESMAWGRVRKADAEADKLRELCADMYGFIKRMDEDCGDVTFSDCFDYCKHDTADDGCCKTGECWYEQRLRELGIEVDG